MRVPEKVAVEQAIARGESLAHIAVTLRVPLEHVLKVRAAMDAACTESLRAK